LKLKVIQLVASLLWIVLPYGALLSFVLGHIWRFRRDGCRSHTAYQRTDRTERIGAPAFRIGVALVIISRITSVISSAPAARPAGALFAIVTITMVIGMVSASLGTVLLFMPDIISRPTRPLITPLDRITLPALAAGLISGVLVQFDPNSSELRNRTAETLFAWFRSLFTTSPFPEAMLRAPLIYQTRAVVVLLIIAIWPYTRLAGIFAGPIVRRFGRIRAHYRDRAATKV